MAMSSEQLDFRNELALTIKSLWAERDKGLSRGRRV